MAGEDNNWLEPPGANQQLPALQPVVDLATADAGGPGLFSSAANALLDWRSKNLASLGQFLKGGAGDELVTSAASAAAAARRLNLENPLLMALAPGSIKGYHG